MVPAPWYSFQNHHPRYHDHKSHLSDLQRGGVYSGVALSLCQCGWTGRHTHTYTSTLSLFSNSVMSDSFWLHGLQHARLSCSSPALEACSNSCPLSWWCHPSISYSVIPFSSCLQGFPASGSFLMSRLFASGGQSFGASASASVLPKNIQDWLPLGWTGLISFLSKGLLKVFSSTTVQKHQFFSTQPSLWTNKVSYPYVTTGKNHSFDYVDLCW